MSKPRSVSRELPKGLSLQQASQFLYVTVPSPDGDAAQRMSTGIPYVSLATDAQRADAVAHGHQLVQLLAHLRTTADCLDVSRAIRSREISLRVVIDVGLSKGPWALQELHGRTVAQRKYFDLRPHLEAFHELSDCLHPNKRDQQIRRTTRGQQVSQIERFLKWAAAKKEIAGGVDAAWPCSLLGRAVFTEYLDVLERTTKEQLREEGRRCTDASGRRPRRDCIGAISQFCRYLSVYREMTSVTDITTGISRPGGKKPENRHLTHDLVLVFIDELIKLGHDAEAVHCAIIHATALDTGDVGRMTAAQIERTPNLWLVHSTSEKTHKRYRRVPMYRWAWRHVEPYLDARIADAGAAAPLFPMLANRRRSDDVYSRAHNEAIASLLTKGRTEFENYEPRQSRHTLAIQMAKRNISSRVIAEQLGTSVRLVETTYAKWLQSREEWCATVDHMEQDVPIAPTAWRRVATAMDTDVALQQHDQAEVDRRPARPAFARPWVPSVRAWFRSEVSA